ncbi:unnamed protein product [Adineta ricciae]|uniref:SWIM-type domain-containing protein n=1 Tax=Adineta ricciae TaxID=249248 RepID=A0A816FHG1_ADIRI|nr:unnamed protein product [Adineta ricciae]CAF1661529.1 unnamed protein product [Adineta ricciae]
MEFNELPLYVSDDENMDTSFQAERKKKEKSRRHKWIKVMVFKNGDEAEQAVKKENQWSQHYTNTTSEGRKKVFRCNQVRRRGKQYDASVYLLFNAASEEVTLFRSTSDHTHNPTQAKWTKIPDDVKVVIKELHDLNLKPKAILETLHERGIVAPTINQLNNYLRALRMKRFGPTGISLGEIEQWCVESTRSIPESDDVGFVVSYEIVYDDNINNYVNGDDDDDDGENKFRFFVSTKRLLRTASRSKKIHADATYKLVWQGFPVLIVGTTDMNRQFHWFGVAVCSNEKTADFTFIFRALQEGVSKLDLQKIDPDILIADGSDAIRNGFQSVFGEKPIVMCWAHMRRKVVKKVESMVDKMDKEDLLQDIDMLQLAQSDKIFRKASGLFVKKWSKKQPEFIQYFENEWLNTHNGWYEGIRHLTPSTNNALESNNRVIKDENTFRERLPLSRFKILTLEIVERWSKSYERGLKEFHDRQTLTLDVWTSSYQWVKLNKSITSTKLENEIEFYVPGGEKLDINKNEIDAMKKMKWYSFDHYKAKAFNVWHVTLPLDESKWMDGRCNCPAFFKKFMCKHIVGLGIRMNYCKPPPAAKNIKIGEKRRRGRPTKAGKALLIQ